MTLVVDGHRRAVSTYAATVADVTREAGVTVGSRDSVVPSLSAAVRTGGTVTVTHARPLTLEVDGAPKQVWVAALTVDEAMDQLGYGADGAWVAASRGSRLRPGQTLRVSLPKRFTVTVDGTTKTVRSARPTVGDARVSTVQLGPLDRVSVARSTPLTPGLAVTVNRVVDRNVTEQRSLPFSTTDQPDPDTYVGIDTPVSGGTDGVAAVTVEQVWVDGAQESATDVASSVAVAPVDAVVKVGAKAFPADVDALNWDALAQFESTGNPKAVNPTNHYGLYQFSLPTWQSVGGTGLPTDATPAEQLARAKMLYIRSGQGQWECGSHLND